MMLQLLFKIWSSNKRYLLMRLLLSNFISKILHQYKEIYKLKNILRNKIVRKLLNSKKQTKEMLVILLNIT